jgi:class 3 adenylate cyclase
MVENLCWSPHPIASSVDPTESANKNLEMVAPELERRLVAILAADVGAYSRLMHSDEEATMATLSARRLVAGGRRSYRRASAPDREHGEPISISIRMIILPASLGPAFLLLAS